jgi:hypothetical protein
MVGVAVCCFMAQGAAADTAIIAFRTPDFVLIGADSKISVLDSLEKRTSCKVGIAKNIAWANADFTKTIGNAPNFDVGLIASQSVEFSGSFNAALVDFDARAKEGLTDVLTWLAKSYPAEFVGLKDRVVAEAVFAGVDHDQMRMSVRFFRAGFNQTKRVQITVHSSDCPGDCLVKKNLAVSLGTHDAIERAWANNPNIWENPIETIRQLILIQAAATPDTVGPPITILEITRNGPTWIDKGACDDQQHPN